MGRPIRVLVVAAAMSVLSTGTALAAGGSLPIPEGTGVSETLRGTGKAEVIYGFGGHDALHGFGGDDRIFGNSGDDGLYGGSGDDTIRGGSGDDRAEERSVHGGSGNDTIYGGADYVDCGAGTDAVKNGTDRNLDRFANCERFID